MAATKTKPILSDDDKEFVEGGLVQAFDLACQVTGKLAPREWNAYDGSQTASNVLEAMEAFVEGKEAEYWEGSRESAVCQSILDLALQYARECVGNDDDAAVTEALRAEARDYLKAVEQTLSGK